ncbi:hypothetical protein [Sneathiella glossodoripedis]|uniref:hypothetical protein n=1 Tax=Sneathiella glossodoripedis TaxID=418853 RepID=UPI00046EB87B|nr:hypothetical protein [Sneathiella glossodoripedis]
MQKMLISAFLVFVTFLTLTINVKSEESLKFAKIANSPIQHQLIEVFKQIYSELGFTVELVNIPGLRSLKMSNEGALDGEIIRIWSVGEDYPNLQRVPTPVITFTSYAYSLDKKPINNLNELSPTHRIGIQRGIVLSEQVIAGRKGIVRADSLKDLAYKLSKNSIDLVLSSGRVFETEYKRLGLPGRLIKSEPLLKVTVYHYLHKRHAHLVARVDEILKRLETEGGIELKMNNIIAH